MTPDHGSLSSHSTNNNRAASIKQIEEKKGRSETPATEKRTSKIILTQIKVRFDADANQEEESKQR